MKNKRKNHMPLALLLVLAVSVLLEYGIGLWLKYDLGDNLGIYAEKPAPAIPILLLRDRDALDRAVQQKKQPTIEPTTEPTAAPTTEAPTEPPTEPPTEMPTELQTEPPTEPPTQPPTEPPPLAVYGEDVSYFDDALFIGDSRTDALSLYARLGNADYFCGTGFTSFSIFSKWASDSNFGSTDLASLLSTRTYGKIYMMLGINEVGYSLDSLISTYRENLDRIQELQPDAKIFVVLIYGVSRAKASGEPYFSPENLTAINNALAGMCNGDTVICLDPRPIFEDEEGYIRSDVTGDGVHPYASALEPFNEWLCTQAQ